MKSLFKEKEVHESYGMIGVHRQSCSPPQNLFGSSIKHSSTIAITIKRCEKNRHLNHDWFFGKETLVEVELSPIQFAEMITSLNVGDGVPCTIRKTESNWNIENPPEVSQKQKFEDEFKKEMKGIESTCYGDVKEAREILNKKGGLTKKEKEKALNILERVVGKLTNAIP